MIFFQAVVHAPPRSPNSTFYRRVHVHVSGHSIDGSYRIRYEGSVGVISNRRRIRTSRRIRAVRLSEEFQPKFKLPGGWHVTTFLTLTPQLH